jgi:hypothetical protein
MFGGVAAPIVKMTRQGRREDQMASAFEQRRFLIFNYRFKVREIADCDFSIKMILVFYFVWHCKSTVGLCISVSDVTKQVSDDVVGRFGGFDFLC